MNKSLIFFIIISFTLLVQPTHARADSTAKLVNKGNAEYLAGKFDEALSTYDEASIKAPESPHIYFNKGAALYQKGDYTGAAESFEKAALKSKDVQLEAKCKFNLGNCAYRQAERQKDSDLNKALEACGKSIQYYQEALGLDPDFKEAAENLEVVRLVMKNILDTINKQKEAQAQQQQTAEQLKELIKKQQNALDRNRHIENEHRQKGDSPELREKIQDLAQDQKGLQEETEELAKNMPKPGGQNTPPVENPAEKHLRNAAKEQQAAYGNLEQQNTSAAKNNQEKAVEELKNALSSLDKEQQCGRPKQEPQQQEGGQQEQQQDSSADKQSDDQKDQKENQDAMMNLSDDAHDILDEEKENKKQRRMQSSGRYRNVDKDW